MNLNKLLSLLGDRIHEIIKHITLNSLMKIKYYILEMR